MALDDPRPVPDEINRAITDGAEIDLYGEVDRQMLEDFLDQLADAKENKGDIVLSVTTPSGDAELVRRIVLEIDRAREERQGRFLFLGKSVVYSAGVTIMSAFPTRDRYLTKDTVLLIHGRQLDKTVELSGSIRSSRPQLEALLQQIEIGLELEVAGFKKLIGDGDLELEELCSKAAHNWYLTAEEACKLGLAAACV